jgi:hypothetical protein
MNSSFQKLLYDQMTAALANEPESNADAIRQAVLNGALLSEYLVKEALRAKNPLAPYDLRALNTAHTTFKKLLEEGPENVPEARHCDIGVLLGRAAALDALPKELIDIIDKIKNVRNGVMHNAHQEIDDLKSQLELIQAFTKHAQPYKDVLSLTLTAETTKKLTDLEPVIISKLEARLENRIASAKAGWIALSKANKAARAQRPVEGEYEFVGPMVCPACGNKSFYYVGSMDVDWNPDGVIHLSSAWFTCGLCEVEIDEDDFAEIVEDPQRYTQREQADPSWQDFFDQQDMGQNIQDYI